MTLDVFVEGCDDSFSCRYVGFQRFRCEILRGWNPELGELYEKNYGYLWDDNDKENINSLSFMQMIEYYQRKTTNSIQDKINKLLNEYDIPYNEGIKIFINQSDCDGKLSPKECELILKSFGRVDPDKFDNSNKEHNEWYRDSFDTWMKMLKYAVENDKSIVFG